MAEVRLIDANALKKAICDYCSAVDTDMQTCDGNCDTLRIIDEQPTIEPDADTYYSAGIKVCPFCEDGGRMSMIETVNGQHYVQCDKCGASREKILVDTDGEAIDIWNSRYMKKEK